MANALLIQEPPLQVLPSLAQKIGLNEAIILQQIHYWLNPKHNKNLINGRLWVWNTYEQWQQQFPFWCDKTIRRAISNLEESGLLDSFLPKDFRKLKHYTINYSRLEEINNAPVAANQQGRDTSQTSLSISENLVSEQIIVAREEQSHDRFNNSLEKNSVVGKSDDESVMEVASQENGSAIGFRPSGQNDQIDLPKRADRSGQNDQIDRVNLTRCINIDTETTYSENTPPLLSAICPNGQMGSSWQPQKEEEKENSMISFGSLISQNKFAIGKQLSKKEEEEEKINLMLLDWNRIVQSKITPGQKIFLTPKRILGLNEILETTFQNDLNAWQAYCSKIAGTRFLMGENNSGFKVTLDWALNVNNAVKILEGAIYDKAPKIVTFADKSWEDIAQEIRGNQLGNSFTEQWLQICQELLKVIKQPLFRSWFMDVQLRELTATTIVLEVENDFKKSYLSTQLKFDLDRCIRQVFPSIQLIEITVAKGNLK